MSTSEERTSTLEIGARRYVAPDMPIGEGSQLTTSKLLSGISGPSIVLIEGAFRNAFELLSMRAIQEPRWATIAKQCDFVPLNSPHMQPAAALAEHSH